MAEDQSAASSRKRNWPRILLTVLLIFLGVWLFGEIALRLFVQLPLESDFYSSIARQDVAQFQEQYQVQAASGANWVHLGWVADPKGETYRIEAQEGSDWQEIGEAEYGSFLITDRGGAFRVWALPKDNSSPRLLGEVSAEPTGVQTETFVPRQDGPWQLLFQPQVHGYYLNDHTVYQDANGDWRLVGITDKSDGNFNEEKYFAVGVSSDFPPENGMQEDDPVADFGELAWAPHVIRQDDRYHMFWSPHKLHQMDSPDGVSWENHAITMPAPHHKFFRDPMVVQVAENQWLLYTTARGAYFSLVDIYQSFNLTDWQYIRTTLNSGLGSERNSPFSSMESPSVIEYEDRYYLFMTYNNDSFFWPGLLLNFKIWLDPASYNETLVLHSDNPYDFGTYRGKGNTDNLLPELETHAPEVIYNPDTDRWYMTTVGWPWVATLTSGEAAVAPLRWERQP